MASRTRTRTARSTTIRPHPHPGGVGGDRRSQLGTGVLGHRSGRTPSQLTVRIHQQHRDGVGGVDRERVSHAPHIGVNGKRATARFGRAHGLRHAAVDDSARWRPSASRSRELRSTASLDAPP